MIAVTLLLERLTLPPPSLQSAYIVAHEYGSSETEAREKRGKSEDEVIHRAEFRRKNQDGKQVHLHRNTNPPPVELLFLHRSE